MAETYGPFDAEYDSNGDPIPGTGIWSQAQWYDVAHTWAPSGVIGAAAASTSTGELSLAVNGLNLTLGTGRAWVRGAGYKNDAGKAFTVTPNTNLSLARRDRIVLRRDLGAKTVTAIRLEGTPASTPAAPTLTQSDAGIWDLPLFSFLVPANSGTTLTGFIDERGTLPSGQWVTAWTSAPGYTFAPTFLDTWTTMAGAGVTTPPVPAGRSLEVEFTAPTCNAGSGFMTMALVTDGTQRATNVFSAGWAPVNLTWDQPGTGERVVVIVQGSRSTNDANVVAANGGLMRLRYRIV